MRTFIGIGFNRETKDGIAKIQSLVRESSVRGRFKYIGNFHLTLKFLGEVDSSKIADISRLLRQSAGICGKFVLDISSLDCFNGRDDIHALWLGLGGETEKLQALYSSIDENLYKIGIRKEAKEYVPHITIAQDLKLAASFEELRQRIELNNLKPIEVREVSLIKSEEINGRRVYTPLSTFQLR